MTSTIRQMNGKTSKLIRKFAKDMGIDPKTNRAGYRQLKKAHRAAPSPEKARATKLMRDTLAA